LSGVGFWQILIVSDQHNLAFGSVRLDAVVAELNATPVHTSMNVTALLTLFAFDQSPLAISVSGITSSVNTSIALFGSVPTWAPFRSSWITFHSLYLSLILKPMSRDLVSLASITNIVLIGKARVVVGKFSTLFSVNILVDSAVSAYAIFGTFTLQNVSFANLVASLAFDAATLTNNQNILNMFVVAANDVSTSFSLASSEFVSKGSDIFERV
jgi:hypothetical protein